MIISLRVFKKCHCIIKALASDLVNQYATLSERVERGS